MLRDILNHDPQRDPFDTHWLEQRVLRDHTIAFAEELLEFRNFPDPLMRFSMAFSQWFGKTFQSYVHKSRNDKVRSANLAGKVENQEWTRTTPGAWIP
jgi:hypothetical protein